MSSSAGASGSGLPEGRGPGERRPSYWCHECQARTTARAEAQELCCVTCGSGFIEEMSDERLDDDDMFIDDDDDDDFERQMMPLDPIIETLLSAALQPQRGSGGGASRQTSGWTRRRRSRDQLAAAGRPQVVMGDQFLQMLLSNLGGVHFGAEGRVGGFVPVLPLYGNPGDYAWGRGGLDAVVTHLLNQMEGAGPAPMPKDNISQIPKVTITAAQVEEKLQCSVCWDDFAVGEEVRKLICEHLFHENCIVPWLQLHATCPVCRKALHEADDDDGRATSGQAASASDLFGPILGAAAAAATSSTSTSTAQSSSAAVSRGPSTATAPEAAGSTGSTISTVLNHIFGLHSPSSSSSVASSSSTSSSTSTSTASAPNSSTSTAAPGGSSSDQTNRRPNAGNDSFRDMDLE